MKPQLPEIRQAVISVSEALDFCRDLEVLCTIQSLQLRGNRESDETSLTMMDLRTRLQTRLSGAIQIRYRYEDVDWIDTLVPHGKDLHLTRIALDGHGA